MKEARRDGITSLDEVMDIKSEDNEDDIQANEGEIYDHPSGDKVEAKVQQKSFLKERVIRYSSAVCFIYSYGCLADKVDIQRESGTPG